MADELRDEREIRDYLSLRGLGLLSEMKEEGGKVSFTVDNVFIAPMVAGRLLALWERRHQKECTYDFETKDNTLHFIINT